MITAENRLIVGSWDEFALASINRVSLKGSVGARLPASPVTHGTRVLSGAPQGVIRPNGVLRSVRRVRQESCAVVLPTALLSNSATVESITRETS
jgi:hypothetical protein